MHIDIAEVRTEEGKLDLFVAIDRTSKLAFAKLEAEANRYTASDVLRALTRRRDWVAAAKAQRSCYPAHSRRRSVAHLSARQVDHA